MFRQDIPLAERNDWESYLNLEGDKVRQITTKLGATEREIDQIVYALFDLTTDEIALVEGSPELLPVNEEAA